MKRISISFGLIMFVSVLSTSCGGDSNKNQKSENSSPSASTEKKEGGKWDNLAKLNGLVKEDIDKALEIGTKMSDCYELESSPGAMDSKMTEACDPFMDEYKNYCVSKFGTDEYNGEAAENKKVDAFRQIMFGTRDELAKSKKK